MAAPCAIAIVGLFRWLVWARALASWILVLATFLLSGLLMGHVDEPDGVTKISHISGLTFPLWFEWLVIVVSPAVVLAPLVVMGWRQAYFKRQRW